MDFLTPSGREDGDPLLLLLSSFKLSEEKDNLGDACPEESRLRLSDSKEVYSTPDPDDEPKPDTYWLKISSVSPEEAISGLGTLWDS